MWILTRSDTNQAVQPLEMARGLKFWIKEVVGLYYLCNYSKNKGAYRAVTAQLICVFVFAYAKRWFSHDADQILCLLSFRIIQTSTKSVQNLPFNMLKALSKLGQCNAIFVMKN